ncbi:hypothetical protein [Falsihalocynthiibacter arcticus]|uniref:Uncharacterized protein n=1 Tax=Falsihalocynthiibacter arcticus TaxID=1579316 RepID=A0A126UZS1_9RHOB|nr:hypothetical protein [Falsihalocynthiibacter arcticus]AML51572.1 hypothetical protein RC74_10125 [Falsihalocynthiibacter arcticus]
MPEFENIRTAAEAIGRITCIKTSVEVGLLYRWDNGDTQAALYEDNLSETPSCPEQQSNPDLSSNRS